MITFSDWDLGLFTGSVCQAYEKGEMAPETYAEIHHSQQKLLQERYLREHNYLRNRLYGTDHFPAKKEYMDLRKLLFAESEKIFKNQNTFPIFGKRLTSNQVFRIKSDFLAKKEVKCDWDYPKEYFLQTGHSVEDFHIRTFIAYYHDLVWELDVRPSPEEQEVMDKIREVALQPPYPLPQLAIPVSHESVLIDDIPEHQLNWQTHIMSTWNYLTFIHQEFPPYTYELWEQGLPKFKGFAIHEIPQFMVDWVLRYCSEEERAKIHAAQEALFEQKVEQELQYLKWTLDIQKRAQRSPLEVYDFFKRELRLVHTLIWDGNEEASITLGGGLHFKEEDQLRLREDFGNWEKGIPRYLSYTHKRLSINVFEYARPAYLIEVQSLHRYYQWLQEIAPKEVPKPKKRSLVNYELVWLLGGTDKREKALAFFHHLLTDKYELIDEIPLHAFLEHFDHSHTPPTQPFCWKSKFNLYVYLMDQCVERGIIDQSLYNNNKVFAAHVTSKGKPTTRTKINSSRQNYLSNFYKKPKSHPLIDELIQELLDKYQF